MITLLHDISDYSIYSISQCAKLLAISRTTLYNYIERQDIIIHIRQNKKVIFGKDIKNFFFQNKKAPIFQGA